MLVVMDAHATEEQVRAVCKRIEAAGMKGAPDAGCVAHCDWHHRK